MGDINTKLNKIVRLSNVVNHKNEKFCEISYHATLTIELNMLTAQAAPLCKEQLEEKFGKKNVSYDEDKYIFTVQNNRKILAVSPKKSKIWKYLDVDSKGTAKIRKIIPEEVHKKLK
jgi:hypothetical protein